MTDCQHTNRAALTHGKDVVCRKPDVWLAAKPEALGIFMVSGTYAVAQPLAEDRGARSQTRDCRTSCC
jgi:hypothetical protein